MSAWGDLPIPTTDADTKTDAAIGKLLDAFAPGSSDWPPRASNVMILAE
jgi:hypothetical protein